MANSLQIQPMPEFSPDADIGASLASRWRTWLTKLEMFLTASVSLADAKRQRVLLIYQAGARFREIFNKLAETGENKDYEKAKDKLTAFLEPQKNRRDEVYCFRQAAQGPTETLDQFHTRLRTVSKNCEFKELELSRTADNNWAEIFQDQKMCPSRPKIRFGRYVVRWAT